MKNLMSNGVASLVFVLAISLIVSFLPQTHSRVLITTKDNSLIKQICQRTPSPSLCESTIRSDARSSDATLIPLALIVVNAVDSKAKEIIVHVKKLLKSSTKQHDSLESCSSKYNAIVVADVPPTIEGLTKGNYKFAETGMIDAANEAVFCEDDLKKDGNSPLTGLNNTARDLARIAASIVRIVLGG